MRNKASLQLMEQLVMILVFALAAALCLQIFAKSREISLETARRDQAVALGRNAAQLLKATGGDENAAEDLSRDGYRIEVNPIASSQQGLALAEVRVFFADQLIFRLDTGWQEVGS